MCTIIKVKRKITEDPLECLILECKKKKIEDNSSAEKKKSFKQILKYGGFAHTEAEIPDKIKQLSSQKDSVKSKINLNKSTNDKKYNFKIQNKKRNLNDESDQINEDNKKAKKNSDENINIIDVVLDENISENITENLNTKSNEHKNGQITCNGVNLIREKCDSQSNAYVYDIYYTKNLDVHLDLLYPNNYEIRSYNIYKDVDLIDDSVPKEAETDNFFDEDEDSNDEDNWRNDYPDEEDDIDDEDDNEPFPNRGVLYNDDDDEYDDYENGYNDYEDDDDPHDKKLAAYLKKSMNLDRSYNEDNDSFDDEYDNDEFDSQANKLGYSKSYAEYKKRILKEFKKDYKNLAE